MAASTRPPQAVTKVSISALVIALPILYVSLLRLPPSTLAGDTTFWFLMSNSIVAIIAADSGVLFFRSASSRDGDHLPGVSGDDQPPAMDVEEEFHDAMSSVLPSLMAPDELPTAVNVIPDATGGEQLPTHVEDHAPLAFIKGKDDAADKPGTEKNYAMIVKGEEEEEITSDPKKLLVEDHVLTSPPSACEGGADVASELAMVNCEYKLAKTEPWRRPRPLTINESLDEAEAEGDDQRPTSHPRTCTADDDVPEDINRKELETEGSRPPEEREYWELSDEELNRKVEEFIMRFNRNMIEQEAGVLSSRSI